MEKITLVIMAAGIGSRFGGGIKQLEPVGPGGEIIMDYSIYDAVEAGFNKIVFVIRKDIEEDFKEIIGERIEKQVEVAYAYQELNDIPEKYKGKFDDRTKPWGTGQAILCCRDVVHEPFLVINADDYYGKEAFEEAYEYLANRKKNSELSACMVGFVLKNTLSDNGGVTRGVCRVSEAGTLDLIEETHNIVKKNEEVWVVTDEREEKLDSEAVVSMNMWGLTPDIFPVLEERFDIFLSDMNGDGKKGEYLLPTLIGQLLAEKKIQVNVLNSNDKWFGVTYKEDKQSVVDSIRELVEQKIYPVRLFW